MPKVKLNRDIKKEQVEYRRNLIESKYHSRGYRAQTEVNRIDNLLQFEASEFARLVRCR